MGGNRLAAAAIVAAVASLASPASADPSTRQEADVFTFADLPSFVDVGDSRLVRTDDGVTAQLSASGLPEGPHTLWWVVWNDPEECGADGCTDADFGDPDVDVDIGYAGGVVVGSSGEARLSAHLSEGPLRGFPHEFGIASGSGLLDARGAEIHLVLRSHGPKVRGLVGEMVSTFHAGCDYAVFGGIVAEDAYGTAGPNTCEDLVFAVHD